MLSRIFDFPDPFKPVMALKEESQPEIEVRTGYDLKPSRMSSVTRIEPTQASRKLRICRRSTTIGRGDQRSSDSGWRRCRNEVVEKRLLLSLSESTTGGGRGLGKTAELPIE